MKYILIFMVLILASCTTPQKYNNLIDLKKGQNLQQDLERFEDYMPEDLVEIEYMGNKYQVIMMRVPTAHIHIVGKNHNHKSVGLTQYYLIYEQEKLVYWGYGYELNRDTKMVGLSTAVLDYIGEL